MKTEKFTRRLPTKIELLEDYKNHPEEFDKDGWYLCTLDTTSGYWIRLRMSDGTWYSNGYSTSNYVRCVRDVE